MLTFKYSNFNEVYYGLNRWVAENVKEGDAFTGSRVRFRDIVIQVDSPRCDIIDLSKCGYKRGGKWNILVNKYIDKDALRRTKEELSEGKDNVNFSFVDRYKRGNSGGDKSGCLKQMVFVKEKKGSYYVSLFWRAVQIETKFAVDLILIYRVLEYLGIEVKGLNLHLVDVMQDGGNMAYLLEPTFNIKPGRIKGTQSYHKAIQKVIPQLNRVFPTSSYNSLRMCQEVWLDWFTKAKTLPLTYEKCKLDMD